MNICNILGSSINTQVVYLGIGELPKTKPRLKVFRDNRIPFTVHD